MAMRAALATRRLVAAPIRVNPLASLSGFNVAVRSASSSSEAVPAHLNTKRADYLLKFANASTQREVYHYTSYALAVGVPAALLMGGPVATLMDYTLGFAIPLHFHVGMRSIILDYVHDVPMQRAALGLLAAASVLVALGLLKFNVTDVGLTDGIKQLFVEQPIPAPKEKKAYKLE